MRAALKRLAASAVIAGALATGGLMAPGMASADPERPVLTEYEKSLFASYGPSICKDLKLIYEGRVGYTVESLIAVIGADLPAGREGAIRLIQASTYQYCPQYEVAW